VLVIAICGLGLVGQEHVRRVAGRGAERSLLTAEPCASADRIRWFPVDGRIGSPPPASGTRASRTWTIRSPGVCAGPTSISSSLRSPTCSSSLPSTVHVGSVTVIGEKSLGRQLRGERDQTRPAQPPRAPRQRLNGKAARAQQPQHPASDRAALDADRRRPARAHLSRRLRSDPYPSRPRVARVGARRR